MERILIYLALIVLAIGYHVITVQGMEADKVEAVAEARKAALQECANSRQVAVNMARAEAMATQAALSGIARAQLAAAQVAKADAQRLADGFARQLVKQRERMPLPKPCDVTQERADLLNRAVGASP